LLVIFLAAVMAVAWQAQARAAGIVSAVATSAALGANDIVDWGQLGPEGSVFTQSPFFDSAGGIHGQLGASVPIERMDQGGLWNTNFSPGEHLVGNRVGENGMGVVLFTPVYGVGLHISPYRLGTFVGLFNVEDANHNILMSLKINGVSTDAADGSALFLAIRSTLPEIMFVTFGASPSLTDAPEPFAVDALLLLTEVPEPGTWGLLAGGIALLARLKGRRKARSGLCLP